MSGSSSSDIAVGLIGFGFAGATFHAPLIEATPGLRITHVASSRPDAVRERLPSVEVGDALGVARHPKVDLVVVAAPNVTHAPLAAAALRAGKHVVVDKPFALDAREGRELAALADSRGRTLSVFHNRRYDSDFLTVRAALARGSLGNIARFVSRIDRFRPEPRDRWRERAEPGSGLLYDLGPHLVDQALVLFGQPDDVYATLATQRRNAVADDAFDLTLRYGSRLIVLGASMLVAGGSPRFAVYGDRGSIVKMLADVQETQLRAGTTPGAPGWGVDPDAALFYDGGTVMARAIAATPGDQRRYYVELRDALLGAGPNPVPPEQAIAVLTVLDAARHSHAERRAIVPE